MESTEDQAPQAPARGGPGQAGARRPCRGSELQTIPEARRPGHLALHGHRWLRGGSGMDLEARPRGVGELDSTGPEVSQALTSLLQVRWSAGSGSWAWGTPGGAPGPEGSVGDTPSPTVWTVTW